MAMIAAQAAADPRVRKAARRGCLVMIGAVLAMIGLLMVAILGPSSQAQGRTPGVNCVPAGTNPNQVGRWGAEQMGNARIIVATGNGRAMPAQGQLVAIMAAMTESALRNLTYGDRDSLGLFQMRPSAGWGTPQQLTDPAYAANKFYDTLVKVPNWQGLPPGDAAQAVERSAFPDRYAANESDAHAVLGALAGVTCAQRPPDDTSVSLPDNPRAQTVINAALSQLGVPYAWGGGTAQGPSAGTGVDAGKTGFDCSGLALFAYAKIGVSVPHQTQSIWTTFTPHITNPTDVQPGDLVLLSSNHQPGGIHHVAIYMGGGKVVQAPQSGDVVKVTADIWHNSYWTGQFIGAVRPGV